MDWIGAASSEVGITINNGTFSTNYLVLPSEVRDQFTDPTLMRIRGKFAVRALASGSVELYVGIIPWEDSNDTPPTITDAPDPSIFSHDWIWHEAFIHAEATTFGRSETEGGLPVYIDSKARRRLGGRKGILIVAANYSEATDLRFTVWARCLLKD